MPTSKSRGLPTVQLAGLISPMNCLHSSEEAWGAEVLLRAPEERRPRGWGSSGILGSCQPGPDPDPLPLRERVGPRLILPAFVGEKGI